MPASPKITRLRFLASLLAAAALIGPAAIVRAADDTLTLTILHDNDLHGHILPFAYTESGRGKQEKPSVGGAARRATLIRQLRSEAKNPVLLIDSGDTFTRGPFTNLYEGVADVEAMNAIGYDLAALGNNEFKAKDAIEESDAAGAQAALLNVVKRSHFPWICANATDGSGKPLAGVQPFIVRKVGPVRIGFLGLVTERVDKYPQVKGWHVADPVETAKTYIPIIRKQCDILIAVTHVGMAVDWRLASETSGIDAIVGGDSHTFIYKLLEARSADGVRTVPIVQAGEFGVNLGKFDLTFTRASDGSWHLAKYADELIPVGPETTEAPDVASVIAPFAAPLMKSVGQIPESYIGKTPEERMRLSTQLWVDAFRRRTGADIAMNPNGRGFFEVFRTPNVQRYDVFAAEPFKNRVVVIPMTMSEVQGLLKSRTDNVISGDVSALDPAKIYKVAMTDYMAASEYKIPAESIPKVGLDMREVLIEDIAAGQK